MLGVMMAAWAFAIWPFIWKLTATIGSDCLLTGQIIIRTIGAGIHLDWKLVHTENGPDFVLRLSNKKSANAKNMNIPNRFSENAHVALRSSPSLQKNLLRYISQTHLHINMRLGLSDAAATALTCATVNALLGCFPKAKGNIMPDFQKETFCAEIRCISAFSLGKLFLSSMLFLHAFVQQRQKSGGVLNG